MARLLLLLLVATVVALDSDEGPRLLSLSDRNFEHDTQAATGQTTGVWLVLFTDNTAGHEEAELALRKLLSETTDGHPLFARVDVAASPKTAQRFSVTDLPVLKLFRDRRMFTYSGAWSAQSISDFIKHGWKEAVAEVVPAEAGALDAFRTAYYEPALQFVGSHPMALAVLCSLVAMASYASTRSSLKTNSKSKRRGKRPVSRAPK